jgi:DNA-binding NtrC family response regulator
MCGLLRLAMMQPSRWISRVIRIAVVEPNEADAYWFDLLLKGIRAEVELIHYSTGVNALKALAESGHSAIDLVLVSDVLPMLSLQEFVDAVQNVYPHVPVVVAGERTTLLSKLQICKNEFYVKPLSSHDIRQMMRRITNCRHTTDAEEGREVLCKEALEQLVASLVAVSRSPAHPDGKRGSIVRSSLHVSPQTPTLR